jgi:hypothetical protein
VSVWGIVALVAWAVAILLANISAVIPENVLGALHASRLEGGTMNQLRGQVAEIQAESDRMRRENSLLLQRFELAEEANGAVTRRVGALEVSVPQLLERVPASSPVDDSVTASITDGMSISFDADGGSVSLVQKPLVAGQPGAAAAAGPRVEPVGPVLPDGSHFGVALGFPVAETDGEAQWQGLMAKVGTLLLGLWPVVADAEVGDGKLVIAGPLSTETQAAELCGRLDLVGIPCKPVPFKGEPLPMLN